MAPRLHYKALGLKDPTRGQCLSVRSVSCTEPTMGATVPYIGTSPLVLTAAFVFFYCFVLAAFKPSSARPSQDVSYYLRPRRRGTLSAARFLFEYNESRGREFRQREFQAGFVGRCRLATLRPHQYGTVAYHSNGGKDFWHCNSCCPWAGLLGKGGVTWPPPFPLYQVLSPWRCGHQGMRRAPSFNVRGLFLAHPPRLQCWLCSHQVHGARTQGRREGR